MCAAGAQAADIKVSAAASLRDAVNELADLYLRRHREVNKIAENYGASGALARQVENGAPADIYISANREWMDYLRERRLVDSGSIGTFAHNTLVFVGKGDRKVAGMNEVPSLGRIAIGSPKSVPAGEYAMEALSKAGAAKQMEKRLVMARDVREALLYAERGEVDGAFVYKTDALQGKRVKILFTVPQPLYSPIIYPMALTSAGAKNREAIGFYRFLQSGEAHAVLEKYGFETR
jgi:molybdate transport system substrate-binding protein